MSKPQQPQLARNRLSSADQDGAELRARELGSQVQAEERGPGEVRRRTPGHHPATEQDKPDPPAPR